MKNLTQLILVGIVGVMLAACSNGMQSKGLGAQLNSGAGGQDQILSDIPEVGPGGDINLNNNIDMKVAEEAALDAEQALAEAEAAIASLLDSQGNLKIFSVGAASSEVEAQFVADKLEEILAVALDKLKIVPQTFDTARSKLAPIIAKLDANNPAHKQALDKIMLVMKKLDDTQARVRTVTALLASKIDFIIVKIDELAAKLAGNVWTAILLFEVERVKGVVVDFKEALIAL